MRWNPSDLEMNMLLLSLPKTSGCIKRLMGAHRLTARGLKILLSFSFVLDALKLVNLMD